MVLAVFFLMSQIALSIQNPSAQAADHSFLTWSQSRCNSVIRNSIGNASESTGKLLGKGFLGMMNMTAGYWISDPVAQAVARKIQLEERESAARALEIHSGIRDEDHYTIVVFAGQLSITPAGWASYSPAAPERLAKIFLEDQDDQSKFVRAASLEEVSSPIDEVLSKMRPPGMRTVTGAVSTVFNFWVSCRVPYLSELLWDRGPREIVAGKVVHKERPGRDGASGREGCPAALPGAARFAPPARSQGAFGRMLTPPGKKRPVILQ